MNESFQNEAQSEAWKADLLPNKGVQVRIPREPRQNESPIDRYRFVAYRQFSPTSPIFVTIPIDDPYDSRKVVEFMLRPTDLESGTSQDSDLVEACKVIGITVEQLMHGAKVAREKIRELQSK